MESDVKSPGGHATIDRSLDLLEALVKQNGRASLQDIAAQLGIPPSTAHRMTGILVGRGLVAPMRRGYYGPGLALLDLASHADANMILAHVARPLLRQLARTTRSTAHLGVWDNDMVTYLVKERGGGELLFTQEGGQLEAYCSGIGKVLLANLGQDVQDAYLSSGPFVPLTPYTRTEPEHIAAMLQQAKQDDFAFDNREIAENLCCIALPVRRADGRVVGAISMSRVGAEGEFTVPPPALRACAEAIGKRLG